MKELGTLVEDMRKLLEEDTDHVVNEENVEWVGEAFKTLMRSRFKKRQGGNVIRFSSLGKRDRQIWYEAHPPEDVEKLPANAAFKFIFGDVIELLLLFLAKEAGHEVTHEQYEVEADGVLGHTDAVIDGVPVDAKSASPYAFGKFTDGTFKFDDPFGYIPQLSGYAHALERTDKAAFLVANKVSGEFDLAYLDEFDIGANPPGPRIRHLREVIKSDTPPPRCYSDEPEGKSGNRKLSVGCSYCKNKDACWSDANGGQGLRKYFYSRGPVFLTEVKREPKVQEA